MKQFDIYLKIHIFQKQKELQIKYFGFSIG